MKGSLWNRWELHMHTPQTKKNDRFKGGDIDEKWENYYKWIDEYIDENNPEKNIKALAVTDYLSIDNFLKVKQDNKLPKSIELILPNVELRLALQGKNSPVNFHCIFNPDFVNELEDRFFSKLKFYYNNREYSATKRELINLGQDSGKNSRDVEVLLKKGIEIFVIELSCLRKIFENDKELRDNTILIVPNSNGDGASGLQADQLEGVRNTLYKLVDAIFSSNPKDIDFFLGKKPGFDKRKIIKEFRTLKPCFHGSDAHELEKIFEPDMKRYCYIKSDTSFEGLKQTLADPEDRVYIGDKPPVLKRIENNPEKIIKKIKISKSSSENRTNDSWFSNSEIDLNPQLTVIIGNKGSGKTALADMIGLCANSKQYSEFLFLNKFKKTNQAKETSVCIEYQNGIGSNKKNLNEGIEEKSETVKYLPQSYFEKLTNEIEEVEKFRLEIENVIFQYLPEQEKGNSQSFAEYRSKIGKIEKSKISNLKNEISKINEKIIKLEDQSKSDRITRLELDLKELEQTIKIHEEKKPEIINYKKELNNNIKLKKYERHRTKLINVKKSVEQRLKNLIERKRNLEEFSFELEKRIGEIKAYIESKENLLDMSKIDICFKCSYDSKLLRDTIDELDERINRYDMFIKEDSKGNFYKGNSLIGKLEFCEMEILELTSKESIEFQKFKDSEKEYSDWETKLQELLGEPNNPNEGSLNFLKNELGYINGDLTKDLEELEIKRQEFSKEIMEIKRDILKKFDKTTISLQEILQQNHEENIKVINEFVLNKDFYKVFLSNINQGRISSYKGLNDGEIFLKTLVNDYIEEDNHFSNIEKLLNNLVDSLKYINRGGKKEETDLSNIIYNRQNLYDYLFGLDFISNEFELRLRNKKLDQLSPGERGAILLIFYLLLDQDTIPLLIDQPEDNLDNQSVANILVPYIKQAKNRRQVIMVTHNPNLAVVSDAELIIYVNIDKEKNNKVSYLSGGIENPKINKKIQDILEGTAEAFRIRDTKYYI